MEILAAFLKQTDLLTPNGVSGPEIVSGVSREFKQTDLLTPNGVRDPEIVSGVSREFKQTDLLTPNGVRDPEIVSGVSREQIRLLKNTLHLRPHESI